VGGAVVGPLLLSALPEVLRDYEKYRLLFYGGMLMVIVCLAPKGVYGYLRELIQIQVFGRLRLK
jgi:ABC-type branched-subunit amino acid transport system permease subunit